MASHGNIDGLSFERFGDDGVFSDSQLPLPATAWAKAADDSQARLKVVRGRIINGGGPSLVVCRTRPVQYPCC